MKKNNKIEEAVTAILFARHMAMCYADTHVDENARSEHDPGFKPEQGISCLNRETSYFYMEVWKHFIQVALPNMKKNGTWEAHLEAFKDYDLTNAPDWSKQLPKGNLI